MSENYDEETGEVYDIDEFVGFANTPLKDDKGYIKAKLVKIDKKLILSSKKRTSRDLADDITQKAFKFIFEVVGTKENITMSILTGTNIRPDKVHVKAKGRGKTKEQPEYNKLTELLLRLKIATIEEISSFDNKKTDEILKRMREANTNHIFIKSKLQIQEDGEFETLNPRTIEKIKSFEFKNSQNN